MNIDFIKWMCDKAEGFEWEAENTNVLKPDCQRIPWEYMNSNNTYFPLLLQRAIEGVNRDTINYITQRSGDINVNNWHGEIDCDFNFNSGIDKAKESALMYIYEQEGTSNEK